MKQLYKRSKQNRIQPSKTNSGRPRRRQSRISFIQSLRGATRLNRKRSKKVVKGHTKNERSLFTAVQLQEAVHAGYQDAQTVQNEQKMNSRQLKAHLRAGFCMYYESLSQGITSYKAIRKLGDAYMSGFTSAYPHDIPSYVLLPSRRRLAVVLSAYNEHEEIGAVLAQLDRLTVDEVFVIENGSTDLTYEALRSASADITIVHYPQRLGYDVGRAVGAKMAQADAILFTDSDIAISAEQLGAFLWAIEQGTDVALNDLRPLMGKFHEQDRVSHCKTWLNSVLGREDLEMNSMTAIPHALSRRAIDTIGVQQLCTPPRAQAIALLQGLQVESVEVVDVISKNRLRSTNVGTDNPVAELIIGDHVEAILAIWEHRGEKLKDEQLVRSVIAMRRNAT